MTQCCVCDKSESGMLLDADGFAYCQEHRSKFFEKQDEANAHIHTEKPETD